MGRPRRICTKRINLLGRAYANLGEQASAAAEMLVRQGVLQTIPFPWAPECPLEVNRTFPASTRFLLFSAVQHGVELQCRRVFLSSGQIWRKRLSPQSLSRLGIGNWRRRQKAGEQPLQLE